LKLINNYTIDAHAFYNIVEISSCYLHFANQT